ncbi:histidine kinase dimerization/phospho-acceptor domain-containing protein [Sphingosinicella sp. CPCC 101087]|uniref:sensor histidine kinase n=1 Tax=Sphingosinicella sp. CPCC 101087 TaxID=2497754 RepID=UPI00101C98C9|nr:histidine kinase dimerization/phospho-acceptor domain-containing protein [Sphingosinicella sp. CPCC 101087]
MRFDDMIATVLAQPAGPPDKRGIRWRQLVDLLAQRRTGDPEATARAYDWLREHRSALDADTRRETARALSGLAVHPDLVAFFAEDAPSVAAPLIAGARLRADEWLALLPKLGPAARALLRHRRDLPREVNAALGAFGSSDYVLEGGVAEPELSAPPPAPAEHEESQIQELVERIEAFRRRREEDREAERIPEEEAFAESFRWETGTDGILRWVEGAPREALVGQSLAVIAGLGQHGVDGQVAGAFEKRAPFRDARLSVAGAGAASGDWRISGVPYFDPHRGNFLGYRGTARRPRLDETARSDAPSPSGLFGPQLPADSLRQLIHELRTPLNAIIGFAEMIEGQFLGPAPSPYRGRAGEIMDQARRLLSAVDDLDTAARIETRRLDLDASAVDAAALLGRLHESYERIAAQRGSRLALAIAPELPPAQVEPGAVERMFARLLAATIGLAGENETIATEIALVRRGNRPMLHLSVDRPQAIDGFDESALLDPGYSPEGDWPDAPALGLGFALRLVRNLAEAVGGALLIGDERISLYLPALVEAPPAAGKGEGGA